MSIFYNLHKFLALSSKQRENVTELCLGCVSDADAIDLAKSLQGNRTLKILYLDFNNIGGAAIFSLAQALQDNSPLTSLLLRQAECEGNVEMVKLFIEAGADIHTNDMSDETFLMCATQAGNVEMAKLFIDAGADIEEHDHSNRSFLRYATHEGNVEMAKLFIDAGADIEERDHCKETFLMQAAYKGNVEMVKFLIDVGADIHARDTSGQTAFMHATHAGNVEMAKLFIKAGADIDTTASGQTALMQATLAGNVEMSKFLIDAGADIEAKDHNYNWTVLMAAIYYDKLEVVKLLLAAGVDIEIQDNRGRAALDWAMHCKKLEAVELLKSVKLAEDIIIGQRNIALPQGVKTDSDLMKDAYKIIIERTVKQNITNHYYDNIGSNKYIAQDIAKEMISNISVMIKKVATPVLHFFRLDAGKEDSDSVQLNNNLIQMIPNDILTDIAGSVIVNYKEELRTKKKAIALCMSSI